MKVLAIFLITLLLVQSTYQKKCYALVFQDGGDFSAYQAGAFQGLIESVENSELQYDVVTGIGFGAMNAAILDKYPKGQEKQAAKEMVKLWKTSDHNDIYRSYIGGLVQSVLFESSVYDSQPLKTQIEKLFDGNHNREIFVSATDLNNGEFLRYNKSYTGERWHQALLAATAQPTLFPYQKFEGRILVSGTLHHGLDMAQAIKYCRTQVESDSDIYIDTIMTALKELGAWSGKEKSMDAYNRDNKMMQFIWTYRDYAEAIDYYPEVNYRYTIVPSKQLPNANFQFAFKNEELVEMVEQGRVDAINAVKGGANESNGEKIVRAYYEEMLTKFGEEINDENIMKMRRKVQTRATNYFRIKNAKFAAHQNE